MEDIQTQVIICETWAWSYLSCWVLCWNDIASPHDLSHSPSELGCVEPCHPCFLCQGHLVMAHPVLPRLRVARGGRKIMSLLPGKQGTLVISTAWMWQNAEWRISDIIPHPGVPIRCSSVFASRLELNEGYFKKCSPEDFSYFFFFASVPVSHITRIKKHRCAICKTNLKFLRLN